MKIIFDNLFAVCPLKELLFPNLMMIEDGGVAIGNPKKITFYYLC